MATSVRELRAYTTRDGKAPFLKWLAGLADHRGRHGIKARLDRLALGNFGDCRSVGGGVSELRINLGPGYRVYFGRDGSRLVILLCGGAKRSQASDIDRAKGYWTDYKGR